MLASSQTPPWISEGERVLRLAAAGEAVRLDAAGFSAGSPRDPMRHAGPVDEQDLRQAARDKLRLGAADVDRLLVLLRRRARECSNYGAQRRSAA